MEANAEWKFARIPTNKARSVAGLIRGKGLEEAYEIMQMVPRKGAQMWKKVVESAVANLENKKGSDVEVNQVFIKEVLADKGPAFKRWIPRAMGRASRITRATSHLKITVAER
jgi:large subunit ribosomal protein L22